jgi:hypothetical protein
MWVRENANIVEEELEKSDKKEGGGELVETCLSVKETGSVMMPATRAPTKLAALTPFHDENSICWSQLCGFGYCK